MEWLLAEPPVELLALLAIGLGALAQSVTGMGFSLVAAPALVVLLGPARGVASVLVLASIASLIPLARDWRHARPREAGRLLLPALVSTPLIAWAVHDLETRWLSIAAGVGVLLGVGLLASGVRLLWLRRPVGAVMTGLSSATLNVVGGVGGPPIGLYAANSDWDDRSRRGTLHTFFLVQNLVTALVLGLVWPGWVELGALAVGAVTGLAIGPRLPVAAARTGVLVVSLIGGVGLLVGWA